MTKETAMNNLLTAARNWGLRTGTYGTGTNFIAIDAEEEYAMFTIWERIDKENSDYANGIFAGYFEVEASISRMGGNTTPEDLLEAAKQIKLAAEFAKECESMDLSFRG